MAALKYWIWLAEKPGVSSVKAMKLLEQFGSPEKIFFAREEELKKAEGINQTDIDSLLDKGLQEAVKITEFCRKYKVKILTINDSGYPERLRHIYDPPIVLYVLGNLPDVDDEAAVAIVGTRKCSGYGERNAERIAREYAYCGGLVVTGMALGIDSAAARGAIKGGGKVIAVLGSGIDVLYPTDNRKLFREVFRNGAIITEFPPGTRPYGGNFPRRNRIISGLSVGVLVVEAPEKSGSLITAAKAAEQGRDVYAIPGDIDKPSFAGSIALLQDGAAMITTGYELADEYIALYPDKLHIRTIEKDVKTIDVEPEEKPEKEKKPKRKTQDSTKIVIDNANSMEYIDLSKEPLLLDDDEKQVTAVMNEKPMHVDDIIAKSELPAAKVLAALTMLEIKGYAVQHTGKNFTLGVKIKN